MGSDVKQETSVQGPSWLVWSDNKAQWVVTRDDVFTLNIAEATRFGEAEARAICADASRNQVMVPAPEIELWSILLSSIVLRLGTEVADANTRVAALEKLVTKLTKDLSGAQRVDLQDRHG